MRKLLKPWSCWLLTLLLLVASQSTKAQKDGLSAVSSKYAIKNATIIVSPEKTLSNAHLIIEDGLITSVGPNVSIPIDAIVVEADSMFVYPGFISGLSNLGIEKPKSDRKKLADELTATPPDDYAGITPSRSVFGMLDPKEKSIASFKKLGFTAAHTVPHKGMLPGLGSIILLDGEDRESMMVVKDVATYAKLEGAGGVYPNTVIGVMAKYRDLYQKAKQAKAYQTKYEANPQGMARPDFDETLTALFPVVDKQRAVFFQSEGIKDIMRVNSLQQELGFKAIYGEIKQGWDIIPTLSQSGSAAFLSLDLPEWKEEEEKSKDEEEESTETEESRLKSRQLEIIKKYYTQAAAFKASNISFGFSTMEVKAKDFKSNLLKVIENGLSEKDALAALTTTPASILGISATMGSLEVGKMANFFIADTAYFSKDSNIRYVFIDGKMEEYEVKEKKKKKAADGEEVNASGTWQYTTETPQGEGEGVIKITGTPGNYAGTVSVSYNNSTNEIQNIEVSGSNISFSFMIDMGEEVTVEMSMDVTGDTFEGTLSVASFGSFPMEGSKKPENRK